MAKLTWPSTAREVCGSAKMQSGWFHATLLICIGSSYAPSGVRSLGAVFIKSGVWLVRVIESEPVVSDAFGLEAVLQSVQIDCLLLERSTGPFEEDIVQIAAPPIHRDFDVRFGQGCDRD